MRRLLLVLAINIFAPALSAENLNSHYDYTLLGNFGTACLGYSKGYLNGSQTNELLGQGLWVHDQLYKGNKQERMRAQKKVATSIWREFPECKSIISK